MKGLVVKSPHIERMLDGEKTWEIRGKNTTIRGTIALIKSGSGTILGTIDIIDSKEISLQEYQENDKHHCVSKDDGFVLNYKRIYAWVVRNPVRFKQQNPYKHPKGAVIWVNLDEKLFNKYSQIH
ncbi:hypothetical protein bcgnr5378_09250 [Bacillus cereus]